MSYNDTPVVNKMLFWEQDYISLVKYIMSKPTRASGHNHAAPTHSVHGITMRVDLSEWFPVITHRCAHPHIAIDEMMFFLRGEHDTSSLRAKGIHIWDANTNRHYLDSVGLSDIPEWDMGKGYGVMLRQWDASGAANPIDQIACLIHDLSFDPGSRRNLVTHWNPAYLSQCALPPCHVMHQYLIQDDMLDCVLTMRSCDLVYGLPYNIMEYAFLMHWLCLATHQRFGKHYRPRELIVQIGDAHVYQNQVEYISAVFKQVEQRSDLELQYPKFRFNEHVLDDNVDLYSLEYTRDMQCEGYKYCPAPPNVVKPKMSE